MNSNFEMYNNDIFLFLKPKENDLFSTMNGLDLQELLYYINHYYLELRSNLGFDKSVTFGLELEFEDVSSPFSDIVNDLKKYNLSEFWNVCGDASLYYGCEIKSPILNDELCSWKNLEIVCDIASQYGVIEGNSGAHVHIGTQVLGDNVSSWLNFLKLWSVYENVIYRFCYGNTLTSRDSILKYAEPVALIYWQVYQNIDKDINLYGISNVLHFESRYYGVNFQNVNVYEKLFSEGNTIEFRCPNGTLEPVIWQNNVNLFVNLLCYAKSSRYNEDIIQKRRNLNGTNYLSLFLYDEVYLQQALELCDMLFTNNLDKVYFLRQYLKSFEHYDGANKNATSFIRKRNK